jgi:RNA polymerase sigma factor (sigma-70 family)
MNAYRAIERGERPVREKNWLITIAHNVCRQRYRQASRRPTEVGFTEDVAEALVPSDEAPTAADIQRALGQLELSHREVLVMRELQGRSYAEIAEVLGLSIAAVETLLFRARRALREQLEGTLTCAEAEAALSRQLDGRLTRTEAGFLRAHLRACDECKRLARRQRAQRKGMRALGAIPVPATLGSWFGGGAAVTATGAGGIGVGIGIAAKGAVAVVAAVAAGAGTYTAVQHATAPPKHHRRTPPPAAPTTVAPATTSQAPTVKHRPVTVPVRAHGKPVAHPTHPTHPLHPTRPVHPTHTTQPVHPTHPVKPAHPATGSTKPKTTSRPAHPVKTTKPTHPVKPAKVVKTTQGSQPAAPAGQHNGQGGGQVNGHAANTNDNSSHAGK